MQLTSLSLALTRAGFLQFSPDSLFTNGEQGVWYEPSLTNGTCFQDSAGTQPVTAVEQPVGLMLDKSKGLVLGSELVTTPSVALAANQSVDVGGMLTAGKFYKVSATVSNYTGTGDLGFVSASFAGTAGVTRLSGNGVMSGIVAGATSALIGVFSRSTNSATISNISVRELPGNHAFQATSTSRPVLSARYNLLTKTEQFDAAAWTKTSVTVSANAAVSPDGTTTADLVYPTTSGTNRWLNQGIVASAAVYRYFIQAKFAGIRWLYVLKSDGSAGAAWFDLQNGVVGTVASGYTATIQSAGNGFYICSVTAPSAAPGFLTYTGLSDADNSLSVTANGTSGIYIWGADLRVTNDAAGQPAYQRVNTATDYDTTGFKPYLRFDGTDDWLQTNSVNFSSTDKMTVFAGVRKLSDAARGMLVELGSSLPTGAFSISAPGAAAPNYSAFSAGSIGVGPVTTPSNYAAPISNVLTTEFGISTDLLSIRINGALSAGSTGSDQGTGNYSNAPLYIGRRGGTTLPFNGRLYGLIVRGAATRASQITQTEGWLNQRTGAY